MLFKNYSLAEVTYLLIRFNKTSPSGEIQKKTDRNCANEPKEHTHTTYKKREMKLERVSVKKVKIIDTPFF